MAEITRMADETKRMGRRERDVSSRRLPRVDLRQQAGHSAKPIRAFKPLLPR